MQERSKIHVGLDVHKDKLPRDRSDALAPSGHYSDLHCLLLSQHQQPHKGCHRVPGGLLLLRRSGSVSPRR
jgi:hypothetical protein